VIFMRLRNTLPAGYGRGVVTMAGGDTLNGWSPERHMHPKKGVKLLQKSYPM
jgi:hypothetical protein